MTTVWSSDEPYDWDAEDAFDEDGDVCIDPAWCSALGDGDVCTGACGRDYGNAASYP